MAPEFARPTRLPLKATRLHLAATPSECAALAERFAILGIGHFTAELQMVPQTDGSVRVEGQLRAEVTQACVTTLEPVVQPLAAPVALRILPEGEMPTDDDPDSPDEIESAGGMVDLGEACAEQLALALDPYPRLPQAEVPAEYRALDEESVAEAPKERPNPFAALAQRRRG